MARIPDRMFLLEALVAVAETLSITQAALRLECSPSRITKAINDTESYFGEQLFRRSTHSIVITSAGEVRLQRARSMLREWAELSKSSQSQASANVYLKIVAPVGIRQSSFFNIIVPFVEEHPKLKLDWLVENGVVDVNQNGCDLWIALGEVKDESLIVSSAGYLDMVVVASPYHPAAKDCVPIQKLSSYDSIDLLGLPRPEVLINRRTGQQMPWKPISARLRTNNFPSMYQAIRNSWGIGSMPKWFVCRDLEKGRLVDITPEWTTPALQISLARPRNVYEPPVLADLRAHLVDGIKVLPGVD